MVHRDNTKSYVLWNAIIVHAYEDSEDRKDVLTIVQTTCVSNSEHSSRQLKTRPREHGQAQHVILFRVVDGVVLVDPQSTCITYGTWGATQLSRKAQRDGGSLRHTADSL